MKNTQPEFNKFHRHNPHIYALFQKEVFRAIRSGKKKLSARSIIEFIRWYIFIETEDDTDYKINNNHIPYYARLFMQEHPEYGEMFELRNANEFEPVQSKMF